VARFFVDGTYLGVIPSDYIPTATLLCGMKIDWLAGDAQKELLVDYFQHQVTPF